MNRAAIGQKFEKFLLQLSQHENSCQAIALSFALGTLIAILPTPGFGIFVGLSLVIFFRDLSKIAMILSITIWNPLLQLPVYYASYWLGSFLLGQSIDSGVDVSWLTLLSHYTQAFVLGNMIMASLISSISYVVVFRLVSFHRRRRAIIELVGYYQLSSKQIQSV